MEDKDIIINEDGYFKHFPKNGEEKSDKISKALEIALDTRKFEIELYWKRANYFWLFVSVVFIGWYNIYEKSLFINFLIMSIGLIVSFCWFCVNRGSKFWQENWESNIKYLSIKLNMPIFGLISYDYKSPFNLISKYPYSVSKVNQVVNIIITLFWIILIYYQLIENLVRQCNFVYQSIFYILVTTVSIAIIIFLIHSFSKGFASKIIPKANGKGNDDAMFYNY